ncbi:hypothetical protein PENTCL1PPCAC_12569, partial [Pristionchus entomophagus]
DDVNEERADHFSALPFDCTLAIFAHIDRSSLDLVKCASKKISSTAIHHSLKNIKIKKRELIIGQGKTEKWHLFNLVPINDAEKKLSCCVKEDGETKLLSYQKSKPPSKSAAD